MGPVGANNAGFWWSWRISSGFLSGVQCFVAARRPFHQPFSMSTNPHVVFFSGEIKMRRRSRGVVGKMRRSKQRRDWSPWSVFNQESGAEICLWADVLLWTGPHTHRTQSLQGCPISAEKCSSASAGGAHQRRLVINHHFCSRLLPVLLPIRKKGRRRRENHSGQQIPLTNNQIGELV